MNARLWKVVGAVALGLLVALAAGYLWGSSGRLDLQRELGATRLRLHLTEARGRLLAARVDLYSLNFGSATRNLEEAKPPLDAALARFEQERLEERASEVRAALAATEEARRLAAQVNPAAQGAAERAYAALDEAARVTGR